MSTDVPERIHGNRDPLRVSERVRQCAALKLQGLTWEEAGARTVPPYPSRGAAYKAVMPHIRRLRDETLQDLKDILDAQLNRAAVPMYAKVLNGDVRAHDSWLRNRKQWADLHGLNAPVQVAISVGVAAEVDDALAELEEYAAGQVVRGTVVSSLDDPDEEERHG